ncbi:MAG: hypothetical protein ACC652_15985, partial [Acidimicrobiales bacterium]
MLALVSAMVAAGCSRDGDPATRAGVSTDPVLPATPTEEIAAAGTSITFSRPQGGDPTSELRVGTGDHSAY